MYSLGYGHSIPRWHSACYVTLGHIKTKTRKRRQEQILPGERDSGPLHIYIGACYSAVMGEVHAKWRFPSTIDLFQHLRWTIYHYLTLETDHRLVFNNFLSFYDGIFCGIYLVLRKLKINHIKTIYSSFNEFDTCNILTHFFPFRQW